MEPMELVGQSGTAKYLNTVQPAFHVPPGYKAIFKTGTIVEGNEGRESECLMFVLGRWENNSFVVGETFSGFLYMEKSKEKDPKMADGNMKKFAFAAPLLNDLFEYLITTRRTQ